MVWGVKKWPSRNALKDDPHGYKFVTRSICWDLDKVVQLNRQLHNVKDDLPSEDGDVRREQHFAQQIDDENGGIKTEEDWHDVTQKNGKHN